MENRETKIDETHHLVGTTRRLQYVYRWDFDSPIHCLELSDRPQNCIHPLTVPDVTDHVNDIISNYIFVRQCKQHYLRFCCNKNTQHYFCYFSLLSQFHGATGSMICLDCRNTIMKCIPCLIEEAVSQKMAPWWNREHVFSTKHGYKKCLRLCLPICFVYIIHVGKEIKVFLLGSVYLLSTLLLERTQSTWFIWLVFHSSDCI